jgi:hypothetical protein
VDKLRRLGNLKIVVIYQYQGLGMIREDDLESYAWRDDTSSSILLRYLMFTFRLHRPA